MALPVPPDTLFHAVTLGHAPPVRIPLKASQLSAISTALDLANCIREVHQSSTCGCDVSRVELVIWVCNTRDAFSPQPGDTQATWNKHMTRLPQSAPISLRGLRNTFGVQFKYPYSSARPTRSAATSPSATAAPLHVIPDPASRVDTPASVSVGVPITTSTPANPATSLDPDTRFECLGHGVFKHVGEAPLTERLGIGSGKWYTVLPRPGQVFVDNTAQLGSLAGGTLLQSDSKLYVTFMSQSPFSARQLASCLATYHDRAPRDSGKALLPLLDMSRSPGGNSTPGTHYCLTIDFYRVGVAPSLETASALEDTLRAVIKMSIQDFLNRYQPQDHATYAHPEPTEEILTHFFEWLSVKLPEAKLFVTVLQPELLIERQYRAAEWEDYWDKSSTLCDRLGTIRNLLLIPIWTVLGRVDSIIRKCLVTGAQSGNLVQLRRPPSHLNVPPATNLTPLWSLHGFSAAQVRVAFDLDAPTFSGSSECLDVAYGAAESPVSGSQAGLGPIYLPESVNSVFAVAPGQREDAEKRRKSYIDKLYDQAGRVLFGRLLRGGNGSLRALLSSCLTVGATISQAQVTAPRGQCAAAKLAVGSGLMARCIRVGDGAEQCFALSGGGSRIVLERLLEESKLENYRSKYERRKRTRQDAYKHAADNLLHRLKLDGISSLDDQLTAANIAQLLADYYGVLNHPQHMPVNEADFQSTIVHLLRALVTRATSDTFGFTCNVQVEVFLRTKPTDPKDSGNRLVDVLLLLRRRHGPDRLYIFELKYYKPEKTMSATHKELQKTVGEGAVLKSQTLTSWPDNAQTFMDELASIKPKNLPPGWSTVGSRLAMRFELKPQHICASYDDSKTGKPETKFAVQTADGACTQAEGYRDIATHGVTAVFSLTSSGEYGIADDRITDLGPGNTEIIPVVIVNVAGSLFFVRTLTSCVLDRMLGIVNVYPWSEDPNKASTDALLARKCQFKGAW